MNKATSNQEDERWHSLATLSDALGTMIANSSSNAKPMQIMLQSRVDPNRRTTLLHHPLDFRRCADRYLTSCDQRRDNFRATVLHSVLLASLLLFVTLTQCTIKTLYITPNLSRDRRQGGNSSSWEENHYINLTWGVIDRCTMCFRKYSRVSQNEPTRLQLDTATEALKLLYSRGKDFSFTMNLDITSKRPAPLCSTCSLLAICGLWQMSY